MANLFMRLFFNQEKLAETNAKFKARMAEIDAHDAEISAAIAKARAENKATLKTEFQLNNQNFKRKWNAKRVNA